MGATAHLKSISPAVLAHLRQEPRLVEAFVCALPPSFPPEMPAEMARQVMESIHDPDFQEELEGDIRSLVPEHADAVLTD